MKLEVNLLCVRVCDVCLQLQTKKPHTKSQSAIDRCAHNRTPPTKRQAMKMNEHQADFDRIADEMNSETRKSNG